MGTYKKELNGIGNVGYAFSNHDITLEIDISQTEGKFVSQSDSTKFRDFYVALVPRYRDYTAASDDTTYTYDYFTNGNHGSAERVPNTRDHGTGYKLTVKGPHFLYVGNSQITAATYKANYAAAREKTVEELTPDEIAEVTAEIETKLGKVSSTYNDAVGMIRFWWDILICFDPLTSEDISHLANKDDYYARIKYKMTCSAGNGVGCADHNQSGYIDLRGYYADNSFETDNVFIVITPDSSASRLNLDDLIVNQREETIAKLSISSPIDTSGTTKYINHVKFFISASPSYNNAFEEGFKLKQYYPSSDHSLSFSIKVYDSGGNIVKRENGNDAVYDGTDSYTGLNTPESLKAALRLTDYTVTRVEKKGKTTTQLAYDGSVKIAIDVPDGYVVNQGTSYQANLATFGGIYKAYIYYHVVWE